MIAWQARQVVEVAKNLIQATILELLGPETTRE